MIVTTRAAPPVAIVDPQRLIPRFWATAWTLGLAGKSLAENTLKTQLRHVDAFYLHCDLHFGRDSLDSALSNQDADALQKMSQGFYFLLTSNKDYNTTTVQRWDATRNFIQSILRHFAVENESCRALSEWLEGMERIRTPRRGDFKFARSLPVATLADLLEIARPDSGRNPFRDQRIQWRNWFILHLLLLCGLRRGEALILALDALKHDVHPESGECVYWMDVTTTEDGDTRATRPSIKTVESHRQIPVSADMALLYERYVTEFRTPSDHHGFLLTSRRGDPLSAESVTKTFEKYSASLSRGAKEQFRARTGDKKGISPHDLRHTCATARYRDFMAQQPDRELAVQRMRAFFGWSTRSNMPDLYARAAIQDDLLRAWNDLFNQKLNSLRGFSV